MFDKDNVPAEDAGIDEVAEDDDAFDPNPLSAIAHSIGKAFGYEAFETDELEDGTPVVTDEALLEAAERAVAGLDPEDAYENATEEWVEVMAKRHLSGMFGDAGFTAAMVTAPLTSADIPFAWDPYPPESMPSMRAGYGIFDRPFTLMVPASRLEEAREILRSAYPELEL
ncbi:MAG TPA: hypothetical protein VFG89_10130 [Coriobacteriia bacterium]|nr:hypothetical protein [Coriobacteriia bacterium]